MSAQLRSTLSLALLGATALIYATPQTNRDGTVEFALTVAGSSAPLPGGTIWMRGPIITGTSQTVPKPVPEITAITDKDGRATLSNLAPGGYEVKVWKTGYLIPNSNGGNEFGTWVTIEPAKPTQKIATSFIRGATISGTISDANGAPIAGASVSTGKLAYQSGRRILKLKGNAQTDDFGNYRLFWFEPGEYYIIANLSERQASTIPDLYKMSYYPGTIDITKSKTVAIDGSGDVSEINFAFQQEEKSRHIKGKVLVSAKVSSVNIQSDILLSFIAWLRDPNAPEGFAMYKNISNSITSNTGEFEIHMPPGSWNLLAVISLKSSGSDMAPQYVGYAAIDIGNKDIDGLTIKASNFMEVKGRILTPSSLSLPPDYSIQNLRLILQPRGGIPYSVGVKEARPAGDGSFAFSKVPPGQYSIELKILAPSYITDIRVGSKSILNDGIFTVGPEQLDSIEVILGAKGSVINGTVGISPDPKTNQFSSTRVVLAPAPFRRQNPMLYKTVGLQNISGAFSIRGIAPGEYKLFAFQGLPEGFEQDPAVIARYENHGRAITVSEGQIIQNVQVEWIQNAK